MKRDRILSLSSVKRSDDTPDAPGSKAPGSSQAQSPYKPPTFEAPKPPPTPKAPNLDVAPPPQTQNNPQSQAQPSPQMGQPAAPPTAAPVMQQVQGALQNGINAAGNWLSSAGNSIANTVDSATTSYTQQHPPLSIAARGTPLEDIADPVSKGLQWVASDPTRFATALTTAAPELTEAAMSTPMGLPLIAGARGLLSGGQPYTDAKTLFGPMLSRMGLS